ncbi:pre-rRNA-processing protein esf2-like [Agrilus planipennis]|uniref:Activator of basal transcription 1 n=1 Tax=Agrilus planipennis TaxID=224129 RepID=A0A1W4XUK5_AGRPL|nr:pre-rRNA-processing protein esf2-like [Agrilus planipennis]
MENLISGEDIAKKPHKRGIIYLSSIPPYMNVIQIREIFGQFGKLGRVYLQLEDKKPKPGEKKVKKRISKKFTEGWIEFERKSVAKKVAAMLNNQQISNRKSSRYYDFIWNIKYLSNFKWVHLSERLAYEKAARRQKLRAEIQLAKKKSNFFTSNIDKKNKSAVSKQSIIEIGKSNSDVSLEEIISNSNNDRGEFVKTLFT